MTFNTNVNIVTAANASFRNKNIPVITNTTAYYSTVIVLTPHNAALFYI